VPDGKVGLVAEPNAASVAEKIVAYFDKGRHSFLPNLMEEKKKYSWEKMTGTIFELVSTIK
jgi:glycosyltransferase involved in cell wall biosynthesis